MRYKLLAVILVFAMMLSALLILLSPPTSASLTASGPIVIDSDADLVALGLHGSGTASDPYVIANLSISSPANGVGIFIGNTTNYVEIENCTITNAAWSSDPYKTGSGIELYDANNVRIENCILDGNYFGICLLSSSFNVVLNNSCCNERGYGHTTLSSVCSGYLNCGIYMSHSSNNTVASNTCNSNWNGIALSTDCDDNTIISNTCDYGTCGIYLWDHDDRNTFANNIIEHNAGEGLCISGISSYCLAENNTCHSNSYDICVNEGSNYNVIINNTATDAAQCGIYCRGDHCTIFNNNISGSASYGIYLTDCDGSNLVYGNELSDNNGATSVYNSNSAQAYDNSANQWNNDTMGNYWIDRQTPDDDHDGIVDSPYLIDGGSAAQDSYPMVLGFAPGPMTVNITSPVDGSYNDTGSVTVSWNGSGNGLVIDHYLVVIDGQAPTEVLSSVHHNTFEGLSDGRHNVTITVVDALGNTAEATVNFTVDCNSPEIVITSPVDEANLSTEYVVVQWSSSDEGSELASFDIYVDGERLDTITAEAGQTTFEYNLTGLADGYYLVEVRAYDLLGNEGRTSVEFRIDTAAPGGGVDSPFNGGATSDSTPLFWAFASDMGSGIYAYEVYLDGELLFSESDYGGLFWAKMNDMPFMEDGVHNVTVHVWDYAGNEAVTWSEFTVDTVLPEIVITGPDNGIWLGQNDVTITWEASDAGSGLTYFEVWLLDGSEGPIASFGAEEPFALDLTDLADGYYDVRIYAYDAAGNSNNSTVSFGVDTVAPELSIDEPSEQAMFANGEVTAEWSGEDALSGIAGYQYSLDGASWSTLTMETSTSFTGLANGEHRLAVRAFDAAGNNVSTTVLFTIDSIAPTVISASPMGEDVPVAQPIVIVFSEPMDTATVTVTVNGVPATLTWEGAVATIAGNWEHGTSYTVTITGSDLPGNALQPYAWSFDTEVWLVTVSGSLVGDNGAPVAYAMLYVDGVEVAVTDANGSYSFQLPPGNHSITASCDGYQNMTVGVTVGSEPVALNLELHSADGRSPHWWFWAILLFLAPCLVAYAIYRDRKG